MKAITSYTKFGTNNIEVSTVSEYLHEARSLLKSI
jgi:hypothetical protein